MPVFILRLLRIVRPPDQVPEEYRQTFLHFYMDMVWFGVLSGTAIAFLAVYATRLGATNQEIGLLTAAPALINLIFTLPVGDWLSRQSLGKSVFQNSIAQRLLYLTLILLPVFFVEKAQVWAIIILTLLTSIPGTIVVVGFNAFFGEIVPLEWRAYVVGIRNAALSVTASLFTLISGVILSRLAFPLGYQIVFAIGLVGAGMSSLHLYLLSRAARSRERSYPQVSQLKTQNGVRLSFEIRNLVERGKRQLRLDAMRGKFKKVMLLLFGWHFFQFCTIPIITPFVIHGLHLSDQTIGFAQALFSGLTFIGSLILNRFTLRFGNKILTGGGIMALGFFPILLSFSTTGYVIANIIGGFAWAMAGGALYNYVLENSPSSDLPAHLAWYNLIFNAGVLLGSFIGPSLASIIGYQPALIILGIGRFLAGLAIVLFG